MLEVDSYIKVENINRGDFMNNIEKAKINFLKKEDTDKWHRHMKEENISKTIFFTQS